MGRFLEQLKHAFAIDPTPLSGPLPLGLEKLAAVITERGMEIPAILAIETAQPLSFLAGQSLHAVTPLIAPFVDDALLAEVAVALEDKRNVRRLIARIEELAAERDHTS